jgi:stage III sporulation protein SpoIIIAA
MFEIIIIDGINRNDCMVKALQNLKPEGVLIIDNVERNEYRSAINNLINKGFKIIEFKGMAPGVSTSSITAILYREGNCLGI